MTQMPEMPRRRPEPLPPPPGAFDTVLQRARTRRYRRLSAVAAVTGVFLAGLWGGLAMAGGVAGVQDTFVGFANNASDLVKARPADRVADQELGEGRPADGRPLQQRPGRPTGSPSETGHVRVAMVRGLVVDSRGAPVVGMFVYTGTLSGSSFLPRSTPAAVTNDQGRYAVPCTTNPVLLTPWTLNESRGTAQGTLGRDLRDVPEVLHGCGVDGDQGEGRPRRSRGT